MGVQIRAELGFAADIGFYDGTQLVQLIILGLAHQRFGNGGDGGLQLHRTVRPDVGHLGVAQPENVELAVLPVHIAGHLAANDFEPLLVLTDGERAELCQIHDQVPAVVIGRAQNIVKHLVLPEQLHHDVFFFIQIELTEWLHRLSLSIYL